jgi:uncharacterized damage-inducible protein DinB
MLIIGETMSESPAFLAERLQAEGEKMADFFASLTEDQWQAEVYTEDTVWTLRNVLAHLVTAERGFVKLFEQIRLGGSGASEDFSIDRYNAAQQERSKKLTPGELLDQYRSIRAEMISWVSGLNETDLEKVGRHPFLGVTTLNEMIKMIYRHNQIHFRDIRKAMGNI